MQAFVKNITNADLTESQIQNRVLVIISIDMLFILINNHFRFHKFKSMC